MFAWVQPSGPPLPFLPYCGAAPTPDTLAHRWNLDPVLIALLLLTAAAYALARGPALNRTERVSRWSQSCFYAGWGVGALAVISPLCPLSVALFSARVGQHLILTTLAAPLIALGRPDRVLAQAIARLRHRPVPRASGPSHPILAAASFALVLWFWHSPGPYTATFQSDFTYWAMHVTTFGAALWLWLALLDSARRGLAGFVAATALTTGQMGLLGAIITFAARPLYPPHALTTVAWGLTPLGDQQLGGVLMWAPAGVIFVGAMLCAFNGVMNRTSASVSLQAAR